MGYAGIYMLFLKGLCRYISMLSCCLFPPNFGLLADDGCYWLLVTGSMVCEEAIGEGSPTITKYVYTSFLPPLLERGAQP